jgi:hypothetical protein
VTPTLLHSTPKWTSEFRKRATGFITVLLVLRVVWLHKVSIQSYNPEPVIIRHGTPDTWQYIQNYVHRCMVSIKYKRPCLQAVWVRVLLCRTRCNKCGTYSGSPNAPSSSKTKPHLQTYKWSWKEQKFGHGSGQDPKSRTTVLTWTDSNLLLCYAIPKREIKGTGQWEYIFMKVSL